MKTNVNKITLISVFGKIRRCIILFKLFFHASGASTLLSLLPFGLTTVLSFTTLTCCHPRILLRCCHHLTCILLRRYHHLTRIMLRRHRCFIFSIPCDLKSYLVSWPVPSRLPPQVSPI